MNIISKDHLEINNPWGKYNGGSILVKEDESILEDPATLKSRSTIRKALEKYGYDIYKDAFVDCPINGNPFSANLILLFNNPSLPNITKKSGKSTTNGKKDFDLSINYYSVKQRRIIVDNLTLKSEEMLFTTPDNSVVNNGYSWYKKMWDSLGWTPKQFSENVCVLQWFPYPSKNFYGDFISRRLGNNIKRLESHKFLVQLARFAISQGKTVIAMRSTRNWTEALHPDTIASSHEYYGDDYKKLFEKNFYINLDNLNNTLNPDNMTKPLKKIEKINFNSILDKNL